MNISERLPGENARVYANRIILDNIIRLVLPPGSAVSENELSLILNVSRTPVREALIEMSKLDLIEIIPQKGSFVTKINVDLIEEARFIRLSLENSVIALACRQGISEHYLALLRENLEQQRACLTMPDDPFTIMRLDNSFHQLIFESVSKQRTYDFLKHQMVHFDRLRTLTYQKMKGEKTSLTLKDHENILYALERKDDELGEIVMTLHLSRHQEEIKGLIPLYPEFFA